MGGIFLEREKKAKQPLKYLLYTSGFTQIDFSQSEVWGPELERGKGLHLFLGCPQGTLPTHLSLGSPDGTKERKAGCYFSQQLQAEGTYFEKYHCEMTTETEPYGRWDPESNQPITTGKASQETLLSFESAQGMCAYYRHQQHELFRKVDIGIY